MDVSNGDDVMIMTVMTLTIIHRVSKKGATKLMSVTSSNLNRFSKFFYYWKESDMSNKTHASFPTTP